MAGVDVQRLVTFFEANMSQYERDLARAQGRTNQVLAAIEQRGDQMARDLGAVGRTSFLAGVAAQFAALLSPILLAQAAIKRISEVAEMGKFARNIGIGVEKLEELRYGFVLAGVDQQTLNRALETFNQKIGEAAR